MMRTYLIFDIFNLDILELNKVSDQRFHMILGSNMQFMFEFGKKIDWFPRKEKFI